MTTSAARFRYSHVLRNESPWRETPLTEEEGRKKMEKNTAKAFSDRKKPFQPSEVDCYTPMLRFSETLPQPISFSVYVYQSIGKKQKGEDTYDTFRLPDGKTVCMVFDGHGGKRAAQFAKEYWKKHYPVIRAHAPHAHQAMEVTAGKLHTLLTRFNQGFDRVTENHSGTTALVAEIDPRDGSTVIAACGDSSAICYRKGPNGTSVHPVSRFLHWGHPKEAERTDPKLQRVMGLAQPYNTPWDKNTPPKNRVFLGDGRHLINLSRSWGDGLMNRGSIADDDFHAAVSPKPKLSIFRLQPGDILLMETDGSGDYRECFLSNKIDPYLSPENTHPVNLIRAQGHLARGYGASDDITMMAVHCRSQTS